MKPGFSGWVVGLGVLGIGLSAQAFDYGSALKNVLDKNKSTAAAPVGTTAAGVDSLTSSEMTSGLKEALSRGAEIAVAQLGKKDGFFANPSLKIPLPPALQKGEKIMRAVGMGKQADDLVLSMNRAAEAAVPEAKKLLVTAVKEMSVEDAKGILTGGKTSATDFFRKKTEAALTKRFLPIVKTNTDKSGLAQQYNSYAGMASKFGVSKKGQATVEDYVTQQSLDRLYKVVGEQERAIRANPLQSGSDLLKKVFGAVMK
ncbi:hypothetical protein PG1C_05550 [Rugosibacter aromaticivorans]|uniref:DUF4197 domain-containing protein n=1 Tax=Rugosibacter aromaticivorans TaxID=1565605 RepID=A0A0C5J804_9PROT|nr:DUF4197 domain-containing protein [Rugosibacter aromaticivorans]AJP48070.1 hypothetical protein PG1C_05550 [Rugosibacter aromaticivorans]